MGIIKTTSVIRFFAVPENQLGRFKTSLVQDNDFLTLTTAPAIIYPYKTDCGRYIVKAVLTKKMVNLMGEHCADYGVEDPLTVEGVVAMQLINCFAGRTAEDVIAKYPELAGTLDVETDDGTIEIEKFPSKNWTFEGPS